MPRFNRFARSLAFALAISAVPAFAATTQPSDLPVRSVTLYTSGVGFFQHSGPVHGDGSVVLKFKTDQVNDLIKSLVVQDDGGKVTGVQYPSQDPLDKTLKTFQIDLTGDVTLASLLGQLRGAKVTAVFADGKKQGTVLSVEKRQRPATPPAGPTDTWIVNLFDGSGVRQVDLLDVQTVELDDPALQGELTRALAAVAAGRNDDKKPVTIAYTGQPDQTLRLGYVVETPVWKTSYRLLLADKAGDENASAKDYLQGWAVVENQTDADWNDITLNLVSGRPLSFVMDLYQPLYLQRPVVQLSLFQGLAAPVYQEGQQNHAFAEKAGRSLKDLGVPSNGALASVPASVSYADGHVDWSKSAWAGANQDDRFGFAGGSVATPAITAKLGELFQYRIDHVTLARQQSSLVPIVTDTVRCEPMSIYNETVLPRNPLVGVMLTNSTGKLLPQGPITVLNEGSYAGDARIEDLPAGQKRLLSFGVDLQTFVDVKNEADATLIGGKLVKGFLFLSRKQSRTKTYSVENKADKDRTVVVEHMVMDGWNLVDTPEPFEKTDKRYRFKLPVAKGKTEALKVTQQTTTQEQMALLSTDLNALTYESRQGAIPQNVRDALAEAIKRRQALTDLEEQSKAKVEAINAISSEQQRIRDNMHVVDKGGAYYTRLLTKLNDQESKIETLQGERDDLDTKAKAAREAFTAYLDGLNVE